MTAQTTTIAATLADAHEVGGRTVLRLAWRAITWRWRSASAASSALRDWIAACQPKNVIQAATSTAGVAWKSKTLDTAARECVDQQNNRSATSHTRLNALGNPRVEHGAPGADGPA